MDNYDFFEENGFVFNDLIAFLNQKVSIDEAKTIIERLNSLESKMTSKNDFIGFLINLNNYATKIENILVPKVSVFEIDGELTETFNQDIEPNLESFNSEKLIDLKKSLYEIQNISKAISQLNRAEELKHLQRKNLIEIKKQLHDLAQNNNIDAQTKTKEALRLLVSRDKCEKAYSEALEVYNKAKNDADLEFSNYNIIDLKNNLLGFINDLEDKFKYLSFSDKNKSLIQENILKMRNEVAYYGIESMAAKSEYEALCRKYGLSKVDGFVNKQIVNEVVKVQNDLVGQKTYYVGLDSKNINGNVNDNLIYGKEYAIEEVKEINGNPAYKLNGIDGFVLENQCDYNFKLPETVYYNLDDKNLKFGQEYKVIEIQVVNNQICYKLEGVYELVPASNFVNDKTELKQRSVRNPQHIPKIKNGLSDFYQKNFGHIENDDESFNRNFRNSVIIASGIIAVCGLPVVGAAILTSGVAILAIDKIAKKIYDIDPKSKLKKMLDNLSETIKANNNIIDETKEPELDLELGPVKEITEDNEQELDNKIDPNSPESIRYADQVFNEQLQESEAIRIEEQLKGKGLM